MSHLKVYTGDHGKTDDKEEEHIDVDKGFIETSCNLHKIKRMEAS